MCILGMAQTIHILKQTLQTDRLNVYLNAEDLNRFASTLFCVLKSKNFSEFTVSA